jgi:hypothetical protein
MIPAAARQKAMMAANAVEVTTMREAAILGGIVRCVCACGRYNGPWIAQYAADIIGAFRIRDVDPTPPGLTEMSAMLEAFEESYSRPSG